MRLFVAIPVPDSVKQYARMFKNDLSASRADVKWVEYANYHLTVKFLGEVEKAVLPAINTSLVRAADSCPSFNLSVDNLGFFPSRMRPRVIWLGLRGELDKAKFLGERVDAYLAAAGFEPEKNHRFHLTLGRVRSEARISEMLQIVERMAGQKKLVPFKVDHIHLMQSSLSPGGPDYTVLEMYELKG
ncbi:MAG: RNA 2',3'-cyclic phosphodiesterase [Syntrophomonadaceae bacterium]|nr:RNA 2',3'-cyclic phosphodiesterase [Syntrophomonadaceae bacterium]